MSKVSFVQLLAVGALALAPAGAFAQKIGALHHVATASVEDKIGLGIFRPAKGTVKKFVGLPMDVVIEERSDDVIIKIVGPANSSGEREAFAEQTIPRGEKQDVPLQPSKAALKTLMGMFGINGKVSYDFTNPNEIRLGVGMNPSSFLTPRDLKNMVFKKSSGKWSLHFEGSEIRHLTIQARSASIMLPEFVNARKTAEAETGSRTEVSHRLDTEAQSTPRFSGNRAPGVTPVDALVTLSE